MKRFLCCTCFIVYAFLSKAQITFNKTYDNNVDCLFNVCELADSSYFIAQFAGIFPAPTTIKHIKKNGVMDWQKQYGDLVNEYHNSYNLVQTYDGNFITGAYNYNSLLDTRLISLLKLSVDGDSLWTRDIYPPLGFYFNSSYLVETSDRGFLITGQIVDTLISDGDLLILKTDSLGNELWHKTFGGTRFDAGYSSIELPDKSFLSLGWTRSFGFGNNNNRDYYLVKTDSLGNFQWQKTYGFVYDDVPVGITATADGNYLLAGGQVANATNGQGNITKIDTAGNIIWNKQYGDLELDEFWWARELDNGDIAAIGSYRDTSNMKDRGWIVRTDSSGNLLWDRSFQRHNDHSYFRDFKQTLDKGFICAGFVFQGASGTQDAWLVKIDSLGCDQAGCAIYTGIEENNPNLFSNNSLHLFPNPVKDVITLDFTRNPFTFVKISVFNTLGQQVLSIKQPVRDFLTLDVGKLNAGIYTVMAEYEGLRETGKFVKQ